MQINIIECYLNKVSPSMSDFRLNFFFLNRSHLKLKKIYKDKFEPQQCMNKICFVLHKCANISVINVLVEKSAKILFYLCILVDPLKSSSHIIIINLLNLLSFSICLLYAENNNRRIVKRKQKPQYNLVDKKN